MRILIVEDNTGYGEALEAAVSLIDGFSVAGRVGSGAQALDFARRRGGDLGIIILDLRLPEGTGTEILPELKKLAPGCAVMMLTQSGKEHDVVQAIARGADGYLLKSASIDQIATALKTLAAGGSPIDPQVAGFLLSHLRPPTGGAADLGVLTDREVEVLGLLARGRTKKEIASDLHVSYATVDSHVRNVYTKLKAGNVAEAITRGYKSGLLKLE